MATIKLIGINKKYRERRTQGERQRAFIDKFMGSRNARVETRPANLVERPGDMGDKIKRCQSWLIETWAQQLAVKPAKEASYSFIF